MYITKNINGLSRLLRAELYNKKLKSIKDFRILYTDKLPLQKEWRGNDEGKFGVKISRVDLHRWIDINRSGNKGLSASMKETLKSLGYIQ